MTRTPLWCLLAYADNWNARVFDVVLFEWLTGLEKWGIDLEKYGERERPLWPRLSDERGDEINNGTCYGFGYGPCVRDWKLFYEHPGDRYAGVFWDMIEHPERMIPGSFMEPEEDMWEDDYFEDSLRQKLSWRHAWSVLGTSPCGDSQA